MSIYADALLPKLKAVVEFCGALDVDLVVSPSTSSLSNCCRGSWLWRTRPDAPWLPAPTS
ncbi:hypothetical protein [Nannocystis pusilla]|uniref:hypothetical protein n=1 Tax=Nannocystis pusilla TaxID=889268 RepID=UPI003DA5F881